MTVIPMRQRTPTQAVPAPEHVHPYVTLTAGARNALTTLKGRVGDLERIFCGGATTLEQAARIEKLTLAIQTEAATIRRLSR